MSTSATRRTQVWALLRPKSRRPPPGGRRIRARSSTPRPYVVRPDRRSRDDDGLHGPCVAVPAYPQAAAVGLVEPRPDLADLHAGGVGDRRVPHRRPVDLGVRGDLTPE